MEEKKSIHIGLGTVVCIFIIFLLILSNIGILYYYQNLFNNNSKVALKSNTTNANSTKDNNQITQDSSNITVADSVNYTENYFQMFKVKLPKIVGNTKTIDELNSKILNEVLPCTYSHSISHAEQAESMDKGSIYDYSYTIKNDILVIYIYSSVPQGGSAMPATGGGLNQFSYCYDINNDKILSVSETAEKLKISLDGIETLEGNPVTSYEELDEYNFYLAVSNDKIIISSQL